MNKTPVSILQEMMIKSHTIPNYELIHDGGGTHVNTFVYQVTCDGLRATGTGRSKKDAKHEAAKAMLEAIAAHRGYPQLPASPAESPVRTPLPPTVPEPQRVPPNVPFVNAIGALQDLCADNNLDKPEYVQISDVGPPHAKTFTIQCVLATFKEVGVAKTKKQAKHEAAKKMLDKITDLVAEMKDVDYESDESRRMEHLNNEMVKDRYPSLSRLPTTKKVNLGFKLSEYHNKIKNSFDSEIHKDLIEKLEALIPQDQTDITEELVVDLLKDFKGFLSTISLDITNIPLTIEKSNNFVVCMKINTSPEIVQIALGETKAKVEYCTILKLINSLIFFLT